jgi:hypothetical protein
MMNLNAIGSWQGQQQMHTYTFAINYKAYFVIYLLTYENIIPILCYSK